MSTHDHDGEPCDNSAYCDAMEALCQEAMRLMIAAKRENREQPPEQREAHARECVKRDMDKIMAINERVAALQDEHLDEPGNLVKLMITMKLMNEASERADAYLLSGGDEKYCGRNLRKAPLYRITV